MAFDGDKLAQRRANVHTIAAYRDTFRLLLHHAQCELGKAPSALAVTDIDAAFVGRFLDHLEAERATA